MAKRSTKSKAKAGKETPLMKQYNAIKRDHPGALLLFRVGDFYETFGADAVKVANILGIVLTKRNNGGSDVELAGFPHHSLDTYLPKLVRAGQRVAVCDQLEDPKQSQGIVKRGVTELVTPGVAISDKILEQKESNYLAAVHFSGKTVGAAVMEVSTGEFFCYSATAGKVENLMQSLKPAEVLVSRKDLKAFKEQIGDKFYLSRMEDWTFQEAYGRDLLLEHFHTKSLKGFGVEEEEAGVAAAGAILHYLSDNKQRDLGHVTSISRFDDSDFVWLDQFTVRNLELIHANHPDGQSLVQVLDHTLTAMGARLLRRWVLFPLKDLNRINVRLEAVESFLKDQQGQHVLGELLKKVSDLERLVSKLATRKLMPREAMSLRNSLRLQAPILEALAAFGSPALNAKVAAFGDVTDCLALLDHYLEEDPSNNLNTGGVIREGVDSELDELRNLSKNSKDLLLDMQRRESERTGISSLKIGFNKVFGYYLEVTNAHKDKAPPEWTRKQTLTNAERYITEELKAYEDKILTAEERIVGIETRLYQDLLERLQAHLVVVQRNAVLVAEVDVLMCFARVAVMYEYARPELHKGDEMDIRAGRHPVIERGMAPGQHYVPNDVYLDNAEQQIIIITGPNMAGKSAFLRQVALIALLAQVGSFVPADAAKIGLVDKIFTRVGASDNISSGESTFMVEMNETARIINNATRKSLILLDEIGRGTSTYDGVSIAWALVEYLHETSGCAAKTLFATHYHELNEISSRMGRVKNYNVSVKEVGGKVIFMRKLLPGGSEHSFGINVAQMAGMPRGIVQRAKELLVHFEQNKLRDQDTAKSIKFSARQEVQLNMFELKDADTLRIREVLAGCDIDRMTPVEALLKLQEIKAALLDD